MVTDEDTALDITLAAGDPDGDPLTFRVVSGPANGVLSGAAPNLTYTPNPDYNGPDSFTFTANDGLADSNLASISIMVHPVNDVPVAVDDQATTPEDEAVTIDVLGNDSDVDGDTLSVVSITQPSNGSVVSNADNTITYSPLAGASGMDSFSYTIADDHGDTDTAIVTVTVTPVSADACELYPIALHVETLVGVAVDDIVEDIFNGVQPGNFGWLTWHGENDVPTLVASLTPPGDSDTYVNPHDPTDQVVSVGDWVQGKPGVSNAKAVRDALDVLKTMDIVVPVWEAVEGSGANANYKVADFALVRILDYHLPSQNRISVRFLGTVSCGESTTSTVPPLTVRTLTYTTK